MLTLACFSISVPALAQPPAQPPPPPPAPPPVAPSIEPTAPPRTGVPLAQLLNIEVKSFLSSRKEESTELAPTVVTVITAHQLRLSGAQTISEALARVPGFYPSRQFFHDDVLGARGYFYHTNDKIVLLLDGHNISASNWTGPMTGDLDELMGLDKVERIEVIHGPGSIMWGDNAILAVVNVVTKRPQDAPGTTVSVSSGLFGEGGGWNRAVRLTHARQFDFDGGVLFSLNLPRVEGWVSKNYPDWFKTEVYPEARLDNFDTRYQSYELFGKLMIQNWTGWFRAMSAHQKTAQFQDPLGTAKVQAQLDYSPQVYSMGADSRYHPTDKLDVALQLGFDKYHFNGRGFSFGGDPTTYPYALLSMVQDSNSLHANANANYGGFSGHDLLVGLGYEYLQSESARISFLDPNDPSRQSPLGAGDVTDVWVPGTDHTASAFGQDSWDVTDHLRLVAGVRAEWNHVRDHGRVVLAPRAAIIAHTRDNRLVAKYMYNTGYRRPNWWQAQWPRGLFGIDHAAERPEYATSTDLEFIGTFADRAKLSLVFFRQITDGVILSTKVPGSDTKTWQNVGDFTSDGLEATADVFLFGSSKAGANFTWTRKASLDIRAEGLDPADFMSPSGRYYDYPEVQATAFAEFVFDNGLYANVASRFMSLIPAKDYQTADRSMITCNRAQPNGACAEPIGTDLIVNGIVYVDANLGVRDLFLRGSSLSVRALNLLNNRHRIPVSTDHGLYQPMPLYVELNLSYKF
jgi:outer membrane receptor protein involved in Fe transport